jgi:glycolate oxidase
MHSSICAGVSGTGKIGLGIQRHEGMKVGIMDLALREEIRGALVAALGENKVLWKPADLVPYAFDNSRMRPEDLLKHHPDFVVLPESTSEVQSVVRIAAAHRIPILPKGGGSNRTGMLIPIHGGIVIDTIRMNRVLEVSAPNLYVTVQLGITLKVLEEHLARHGLALNQEQGSFKVATVGGSISTAGFSRKYQKYGTITDRIMCLEVVLADGRVLRTGPKILYTSTGYRLHQLFVGAEGTLGVITEATLRIEPIPESTEVLLAFYEDIWKAHEAALRMTGSGVMFASAELAEPADPETFGAPRGKRAAFSVSFEGTKGEVEAEVDFVTRIVRLTGGSLADKKHARRLYDEFTQLWCGDRALLEPEDETTAVVPTERVKEFYDTLWNRIMPKYGMGPVPGNRYGIDIGRYSMSYCRFFISKGEHGWEDYRRALADVAGLAVALGGSISSCTGVGLKNKDEMVLEFSDATLETMWKIKNELDPDNIMNPGKKLPTRDCAHPGSDGSRG